MYAVIRYFGGILPINLKGTLPINLKGTLSMNFEGSSKDDKGVRFLNIFTSYINAINYAKKYANLQIVEKNIVDYLETKPVYIKDIMVEYIKKNSNDVFAVVSIPENDMNYYNNDKKFMLYKETQINYDDDDNDNDNNNFNSDDNNEDDNNDDNENDNNENDNNENDDNENDDDDEDDDNFNYEEFEDNYNYGDEDYDCNGYEDEYYECIDFWLFELFLVFDFNKDFSLFGYF